MTTIHSSINCNIFVHAVKITISSVAYVNTKFSRMESPNKHIKASLSTPDKHMKTALFTPNKHMKTLFTPDKHMSNYMSNYDNH